MDPTSDVGTCNKTKYYEYGIYAVLGSLFVASEALGFTKKVKPNGIFDVVLGIFQGAASKRAETAAATERKFQVKNQAAAKEEGNAEDIESGAGGSKIGEDDTKLVRLRLEVL
jgi:hypothetical protein